VDGQSAQEEFDALAKPSPRLPVPRRSLDVFLPQTRISRFLRVRRLGIRPSPQGNGFVDGHWRD